MWSSLTEASNAQNRITHGHMAAIRNGWGAAKRQLHTELIRRGWLQGHEDSRRTPLYGLAVAGMIGACVGFVVALVAQEGWAVIGSLAVLLGGIGGLAFAHSMSELTAEGETVVAPWRGYAHVLRTGYPQLSHEELDAALPYAVAMGYRDEIGRALQATGEEGTAYSPSWFRPAETSGRLRGIGFYPYWIGWHTALYPPSTSGGSGGGFGGGFGGGGAAGGGGGGGGSF